MKKIDELSDKTITKKIPAPVVLRPDQIVSIAAGMTAASHSTTTTGHVPPPPRPM